MKTNLYEDEQLDDIISQMSQPKKVDLEQKTKKNINYDDIDFGELDQKTKKVYSDLFSGMPDYYKIIGVSPTDSQEVINRKCNEKLAKYHPDKVASQLSKFILAKDKAKEKDKLTAQYQLIRDACKILKDSEKRKYYEIQKKSVENKNLEKQKKSFDEFIKLQETETTQENKDKSISTFKMQSLEMDKKNKFDRKLLDEKITENDIKRRIQDLELVRSQQEVEYVPKNIFQNKAFSQEEFNKQFEQQQKKKDKNKKNNDRTLTKWDGISASNDFGLGGDNYVSLETDNSYEKLYDDTKETSMFATRMSSDDEKSVSTIDDDDEIDISYVNNHNSNKQHTVSSYDKLLKERELETQMLENRTLNDKSWKNMMENPFNPSSQLGFVVGKSHVKDVKKEKRQLEKELIEAYKELIFDDKK